MEKKRAARNANRLKKKTSQGAEQLEEKKPPGQENVASDNQSSEGEDFFATRKQGFLGRLFTGDVERELKARKKKRRDGRG